MKFVRRFRWENIWLWASFFAMVVVPWIAGFFLLPNFFSSVSAAGDKALWSALLFGFGWGLGTVMFGMGINLIGLSLGYVIIMGVNTAAGSILPMIVLSPADIQTPGGHVILAGIGGCLVGVAISGYAGILKERGTERDSADAQPLGVAATPKRRIYKGIVVCVISGLLSSFLNLGFSFAGNITAQSLAKGASPLSAGIATWIAVFWGSFPAVLLYCAYLQFKGDSWRNNWQSGSGHDLLLAFLMGILWFGAIGLYGVGASFLGHLGTSVGWAINISASLLVANALGFYIGEWKAASQASIGWIMCGLAVLVVSMGVLGYGNSLISGH